MKYHVNIVLLVIVQVYATKNVYIDHRDGYDRPDLVERPCTTDDLSCIRSFFAQNTGCVPVEGPVKDPTLKTLPYHVAHANLSVTVNNVLLKGLTDGKIKEFYINKKTDTLVLEVVIDSFVIESGNTVVSYYRPGLEPIEANDITLVEFRGLSLTLIIQKFHDPNLAITHVYAYLPDPYPLLLVGPGLKEEKGIAKKWMSKEIIGLSAREGMIQGAPIYMNMYIQNKICNFRPQFKSNY